jgi:uncharacterized protein YndB with AHSA1/START domain
VSAKNEPACASPAREVHITRIFDAPRELVLDAWTNPKHMAQWWGPHGFTNPVCKMDARPCGSLYIVMRGPDGVEFPMSGIFKEVKKPERIVFSAQAEDKDGRPLLESVTTVTFDDVEGKTRLTLHSRAVGIAPEAPGMLEGMEAGWTQSIERLAVLISQLR